MRVICSTELRNNMKKNLDLAMDEKMSFNGVETKPLS